MDSRIIKLPSIRAEELRSLGYHWYLDGDNHDFLVPEMLSLTIPETAGMKMASEELSTCFVEGYKYVNKKNLWDAMCIPKAAVSMIQHSWDYGHAHLLARYDFAGGIEGLPLKLLESNADTATMMPESSVFQKILAKGYDGPSKGQINKLHEDLVAAFKSILEEEPQREPTLLCSSLGFIEDQLNLQIVGKAADEAGFYVQYADLKEVTFSEDEGIFVENEDGSFGQFDFWYKLVPWEFIAYDEPELLRLLSNIVTKDLCYVMNPAYTMLFQSKAFLTILSQLYPRNPRILKAYLEPGRFKGKAYVEKVCYGRMGENITIYDEYGKTVERTGGDFGHFRSIQQEFAQLYTDEKDQVYQAGVYLIRDKMSCISFRRGDNLIIDDDIEFVPHIVL